MQTKPNILRLLKQGDICLLDGAMGTAIAPYHTNQQPNELLNITHSDIVYCIHLDYLHAGSNIITTNTFCANAIDLKTYQQENLVTEINKKAVAIARKAIDDYQQIVASQPCFVAGSVGATRISLSRKPSITFYEMVAVYQQQIAALLASNIDLLLLETVIDKENLKAMLVAFKNCNCSTPVAVSFAVDATGKQTLLHFSLADMVQLAHQFHVDILGVNCANQMAEIKAIPHLQQLTSCYLMMYPNAGFPNKKGDYPVSSAQFCEHLQPFIANKMVSIVGGCCGTTPQYIADLKRSIQL